MSYAEAKARYTAIGVDTDCLLYTSDAADDAHSV